MSEAPTDWDDEIVSVLIPAYNEEDTIRDLVERVRAVPLAKEIVVVDDGSVDRTPEILRELADDTVRVFVQPANAGRGAALRVAWQQARGRIVVHQDADLEYDPADLPSLVQPILDGRADVVYGSRFKGTVRDMLVRSRGANHVLAWLTNRMYGASLTDIMTCYKVFDRRVTPTFEFDCDGFDLEAEITGRVLRRKLRLEEHPVSFRGRGYADGKKIRFEDFFRVLYALVRYRFAKLS